MNRTPDARAADTTAADTSTTGARDSFTGRTVIVTGGAKGVGRGVSEAFLAAGADVVICGRTEPTAPIAHNGRAARFIAADVRDPDAAAAVAAFALEGAGRIDVLINNAGGAPPADAATASPRFSESIIRLNLLGPLHFSQAVAAPMKSSGGGAIVNIASVSAMRPSPGTAAYGAAKAGLLSLTRSLAMEWAPHIRVNAIVAGLIRTEASLEHYGGEAGVARIEAALPMERMARPADIAAACLYLASPAAAYVSGAALEVHGGGEPPSFLSLAENAKRD